MALNWKFDRWNGNKANVIVEVDETSDTFCTRQKLDDIWWKKYDFLHRNIGKLFTAFRVSQLKLN